MTSRDYNIAVLMPTHRRTDALRRSLFSLIDLAHDLESVQFRLGIDNNDEIGLNYFIDNIQPELDARNINYEALEFEPLGYAGLNQYFNTLAQDASADWLFVWCDDAIMQTQDWDQRIRECTGEFKLLKVHTHNEHPYSIFPIYPAEWIETLGHISRHQMGDAESSQIAYLLDLMKIIEVDVTHDRADLTGNNKDEAYKKRELLEGNPNNPRDLHHEFFIRHRYIDAERLAAYMQSRNISTAWWEEVKAGKVYAYQKLVDNDPNGQCVQLQAVKDSSGQVRFTRGPRNNQS